MWAVYTAVVVGAIPQLRGISPPKNPNVGDYGLGVVRAILAASSLAGEPLDKSSKAKEEHG